MLNVTAVGKDTCDFAVGMIFLVFNSMKSLNFIRGIKADFFFFTFLSAFRKPRDLVIYVIIGAL
jgi:hypothetical protein